MKWTELTNVKDILRHRRGLGLTRNENAATAGVSAGTVTNVLKRLRRRGRHAGRFRMVSTTRRSGNCCIRAANRTADTPSPAGTRSSGSLTPRPSADAKSDRSEEAETAVLAPIPIVAERGFTSDALEKLHWKETFWDGE